MKIIDISMLIEEDMLVYKNADHKKPVYEVFGDHKTSNAHETKVSMDVHCGTHIDMPLHMIPEGKTLDTFDISRLICECKVFDMTHLDVSVITKKDLVDLDIQAGDFILFKTKNSFRDKRDGFDFEFVYLDEEGARYLKGLKLNGVGTDGLGIERAQSNHMTHKLLLEDDVIIMEGVVLTDVKPGDYQLIALPIKLKSTEGSWVRAVLVEK